jgi:hypothetical protein
MIGTYSPDKRPKELKKLQEIYSSLIDFTIRGSQVAQFLLNKWEDLKLKFIGNRDLCPRNTVCLPNIKPCECNNSLKEEDIRIY